MRKIRKDRKNRKHIWYKFNVKEKMKVRVDKIKTDKERVKKEK